ncbi:MAG: M64 family metallopeptidase [Lachnospiraceae bacterium]
MKKRLYNRIGCLMLALFMALSMCVSPAATQQVKAGANDDISASIKIVPKQNNVTFAEGKVGDIASYFTVEGPENLDCIIGYYIQDYYLSDSRSGDQFKPYAEGLNIKYVQVGDDGTETALSTAPTRAGKYKAYATFVDEGYWAYSTSSTVLGYFDSLLVPTGVLEYTIGGSDADVSGEVDASKLKLLCGDKDLPDKDAFILLFFGDGFTESEQDTFYAEAQKTAEYVMQCAPYDEFEDTIKIYAYGVASKESGARADKATTQAEADADTRDTYFQTSFWTGGMQRLLYATEEGLSKARALRDAVLPEADFNAIIVNSEVYGGSGGELCVASMNYLSTEMMIHELGHTVGNLADEYWAGGLYAAENVNMSQESDPEKVSWSRFIGKNGIGVYKHNQNETTDWYRPSENCKMQYLSPDSPFCEVCKEKLRQTFCQYSNVTKLFFQPYADDFYQAETGTDMKQYFILRRGSKEVTGDKLGDKLTLVYKDANGNVVDGIPSQKGTYTIEATYAGDDTFDACSATGTYSIALDLIDLKVEAVKTYDGKVSDISYSIDYDKEYTESVRYTGQQYGGLGNIEYDSDKKPTKPGKYTVTVTVTDKASGEELAVKSAAFQIDYKLTRMVDNNSSLYPGAQDWYNNKQIAIVGEGFTEAEQDKFEKVAKQYADYILSQYPFNRVKTYFNFTTLETISEESGSGTTPKNTYFQLTYDKNGKINPDNANAISRAAYYNVSNYRTGAIVIVNDSKIKTGNRVDNVIYGGLSESSMETVAKELLNKLTNHEVGYRATTTSARTAQRLELMSALYYTFYGEDFAVIANTGDGKEYYPGQKVSTTGLFTTYILGKKAPVKDSEYEISYYDSKGNKLSKAPTAAGTYTVVAELTEDTSRLFANDEAYTKVWEITPDQTLTEDGDVLDADGNLIGYLFWDPARGVDMDGKTYVVPRSRGTATFTILSSTQAKKKIQAKSSTLKSVKSSSKKTLKATWATVSGATGYQIQYSTSSTFKNAKTVNVSGSSKTSTTIKKLTSGKKYYVRVRAYRTVSGKKAYAKWSSKKSVKVK